MEVSILAENEQGVQGVVDAAPHVPQVLVNMKATGIDYPTEKDEDHRSLGSVKS